MNRWFSERERERERIVTKKFDSNWVKLWGQIKLET